jgi:hypothetical protein
MAPEFAETQGFWMELGRGDNRITIAAEVLLQALDEGRDDEARDHAQGLAEAVLLDRANLLAEAVLEGGPFAMRKAGELAEVVLQRSS